MTRRREKAAIAVIRATKGVRVHGKFVGKIARYLEGHVERQGGGEVLVGDVGFVLSVADDPERVRAPDVAFVSSRKLPDGRLPEGFLQGAPDLAVEILSPSDNPVDVQRKVRDYLEVGTRLVWVVAPAAKTLTVYRADDQLGC